MSIKLVASNKTDRQAQLEWEEFLENIRNSTPVDINETEEDKIKRIKYLEKEGNEEEWFKYYFPKYCFSEPAAFHKTSTKKVLKAKRLYQARRWARGLSKSTRRMFEIFYKVFVQKWKANMLLISKTETNAIRLLAPYRANLEANNRLIHDYGVQERPGKWKEEEFITRGGSSFRAVGCEQNPRGAKLEEMRINIVGFDDADDDEVCRNPDRLQVRWEWVEQAVIPTVEISRDYLIFFDNNIIAEDCLVVRASAYAKDVETVNIRDDNGVSVWPEKNSEQDIDDMVNDNLSWESSQKEYFNNPISRGKIFTELTYGKCPKLESLPFVMIYADPATSNNDKPALKSKIQNSCKAVVVIGYDGMKYYIYKAFVEQTTNSTFIDWLYACSHFVGKTTQLFTYIENNGLQNPFYEQVLSPLIFAKGAENKGVLGVTKDERIKPDKYFRIEGTLQPINSTGRLIFNIDEKNDPHMKRLEVQFKSVSANSRTMDGPDAVEGGVFLIKEKTSVASAGDITMYKRSRSKSKSY